MISLAGGRAHSFRYPVHMLLDYSANGAIANLSICTLPVTVKLAMRKQLIKHCFFELVTSSNQFLQLLDPFLQRRTEHIRTGELLAAKRYFPSVLKFRHQRIGTF